jgi:hypothetical protein
MAEQSFSLGPSFEAYLTTAQNGGPRTRLDGERIVIVLGRDVGGRPLEVSIYLQPWPGSPEELVVAAIDEGAKPGASREFWPRMVVKPSQGSNLLSLRVEYEHVPPPGQDEPNGG